MFFEDHLRDVEEPSSLQAALRTRDSSNAPTSTATRDGALCVQRLVQATTNERQCPEVLPYPADVIDRIVALLLAQQRKIEALTQEEMEEAARQPFGGTSLLPFKPSDLLRLETQRLQFFLSELLRCRLRKIEALCQAIYYEGQLESGELAQQRAGGAAAFSMNELNAVKYPQRANLSPNERIVADRLALSSHHAVQQAGLQFAPTELQHLTPHQPYGEGAEILPQPRISSYVFGWVLQDLGVVRLIEGTEQDVHAEDLFLVPYAALRPHVIAGQVRLV